MGEITEKYHRTDLIHFSDFMDEITIDELQWMKYQFLIILLRKMFLIARLNNVITKK